jgi:hypothetical protein
LFSYTFEGGTRGGGWGGGEGGIYYFAEPVLMIIYA